MILCNLCQMLKKALWNEKKKMTALTPMCFYSYQNISLLFEIAIGLNFANKALNYLLNHASVIKKLWGKF